MQHKGQADAGVVLGCGVSQPIINVASRSACPRLLQEIDAVDAYIFRSGRIACWGLAGIGILHHSHIEIFFYQIGTRCDRKEDTPGRVRLAGDNRTRRKLETETVIDVLVCIPV